VYDEDGLRDALARSYERIIIGNSFTLDSLRENAIPNGRTVEICGLYNGVIQTLTFNGNNTNGISVGQNRHLTLSNLRLVGAGLNPGSGIIANSAGEPRTITINNVEIKGFTNAGIRANQDGVIINMQGNSLIHRNVSGTGGGVNIQRNTIFNMYSGKIDNNEASTAGGVNVSNYAIFNMHGGYISNNLTTSNAFGGGVHLSNGTFNMYGGAISGNMASLAGGIGAGGGSTITMHPGAVISNNYANRGGQGGGVRIIQASRFYMFGGEIRDNTSVTSAGGVLIGLDCVFKMSGGTISGNTAATMGGGVSVSGTFNMTGGTITDNIAATQGGGVRILAAGELNINDTNMVFANAANPGSENFYGYFRPIPYTPTHGPEPRRLFPVIRPPLAGRPLFVPEPLIPTLYEEQFRRHFIIGYPDGTFQAEAFLTRAEMLQMFFNISQMGNDVHVPTTINFSDVNTNDWFFHALSYMSYRGLIQGFPDGTLRPNEIITYAEFITLAVKFFDNDSINQTLNRGWYLYFESNESIDSSTHVLRAQAVAILNYYQGRVPTLGAINGYVIRSERILFSDLTRGLWSFYEVMEAAFTRHYHYDTDNHEVWVRVLN